tara:strand:+ start:2529 stop:3116 length:588 start_codon:yes stop_codon:yes gene_type:complete
MDIKMINISKKIILAQFMVITFSYNLYADALAINNADNSFVPIKNVSKEIKNGDPEILYNSNVILITDNVEIDLPNIDKIGNFLYELSPGELAQRLMNAPDQVINKREFKLVLDTSKQLKITDGSIIVSFKDSSDSSQIMTDFNLSLKRNLLPINRAVYYVSSFKNIENIITKLREDPRITEVSLDLINPMISPE